jgi:hypothetical protein
MQKEEIVHSVSSILLVLLMLTGLLLILSFCISPSRLMEKSRDARRASDLNQLVNATNLYLADNKNFDHLKTAEVYSSLNKETSLTANGWLPLNFQSISSGTPLTRLPIDPLNNATHYYRFGVDVVNKTFELDGVLESGENAGQMANDGGNNPMRYELGTDLTILE